MRYHHVITGREYESRGEPYPYDFGDHTLMKVPVTDENGRSTVVYLDNLEALVDQAAADPDPVEALHEREPRVVIGDWPKSTDPMKSEVRAALEAAEAEADAFEKVRYSWAVRFAETLGFNEGNAVMELYLGNLDMALVALQRERARRYPAATATPEEAPSE